MGKIPEIVIKFWEENVYKNLLILQEIRVIKKYKKYSNLDKKLEKIFFDKNNGNLIDLMSNKLISKWFDLKWMTKNVNKISLKWMSNTFIYIQLHWMTLSMTTQAFKCF